jgi:hypothetical protein
MSRDGKDQKGAGELPFNDAGADNFKNYDVAKFDYTGHCLPFGLLRCIHRGYIHQRGGAAVSKKLMWAEYEAWTVNNAEDKVSRSGFGSHLIGKGFEDGWALFDENLGYTHAGIEDDPKFNSGRVKRGRAWLGGRLRNVSPRGIMGKSLD